MAFVPFTGELDPPEKQSSQFVPFTGELDDADNKDAQFVSFTGKLDSAPVEEAPVADEFAGFFGPTPSAVEPTATVTAPPRVRTARDQEFAAGEEAITGIKAGAKGLANLPAIFALQTDAGVIGFRQRELDAFAALDRGETITPAQASNMGVDFARILRYQKANPEEREKFKVFNQQSVDTAKVGVQEGLKLYAEFTKEIEKVKGRTPDATDIETATDFANWLSYNIGSGAVQLAPVILAAVTTGGVGAFGVGTALAGQETIQNRLQFVLEQTKGQTPQEQADAVEKYLRETGNTTALISLASGALDLAGPVGTILRKQLNKEFGKEAVKYATKTEAAKAALKRTPRELLEEGATGGAQEALQIGGERYLEEQTGDVFSDENIKRVINAAAAEAAGGVAGSGFNVATSVGQQYVQERAAADLKRQLADKLRQANAEELGTVFDSLITQIKAENPGISEIDATTQAGKRLVTLGGIDRGVTKTRTRRTKPSVPVSSGEEAIGDTTTESTEAGVEAVGVSGAPVGDVGGGAEPTLDTLDPAIKARAEEIVAEAADLGATIPMDLAVERATTELTETTETTPAETTEAAPTKTDFVLSSAYKEVGALQRELNELRKRMLELDSQASSYVSGDKRGRLVTPRKGSERWNEWQNTSKEANKALEEYQKVEQAFKKASASYLADPANAEEIARIRAEGKPTPAATPKAAPTETTPAETTAAPAESIVETPATDPVGFARVQAIDSFDRRNSSDYSDPEEAIDSGLDNLNDTLTEYGVTDRFVREQAVEAYRNEIARLKGEAAPTETVSLDQVTSTTSESELPINPETGLKPPGRRGRKAVVRTPEEQAAADAQRKDRQKVGRDAIRTVEKAQKVIEKPFNQDDYATLDEARAAGMELQQERMNALIDAFTILNDRNISPTSKAKQSAKAVVDHPSVDQQERQIAQARASQPQTARSGSLGQFANADLDPSYLVENFDTADKVLAYILRSGNAFEKLLAQRIKPFLKGVKVVIVNNPETDIPDAKTRKAFKGAMGLYAETGKDRTIYLSNLRDLEGINNVTFLHEAVHGATMAQINAYLEDSNSVSPQARAAIKDMQDIMLQAYKYYAILQAGGRTDGVTDQLYDLDAFTDLKEFVAYGLTQPEMQTFLRGVPGKYTFNAKTTNLGLLTKFVQSIRKLFNMGPQYDSAFQDLVVVTDQLLRAEGPQPSQGTIIAAAKKIKKQNKTLEKIFKSTNASAKNAGIGQLIMETRNGKDAIRLLRSVYDALTVNAVRKLSYVFTTEDVTRWAGDRIVNLQKVNDAVQDMAGMRAKMIRELAERVPQWVKFGQKYEKGGQTLGDVMNASTLLRVDPTQHKDLTDALNNDTQLQQLKAAYQAALNDPAKTPRQRTAAKGAVTKRENELKTVYQGGTVINPDTGEKYIIEGWEQLGKYGKGEGHEIFSMAKDAYKDIFNLHQQLLIDKITKANIPGQVNNPSTPKGKLIAQITQSFQEAQQLGLYFPLMRYGNFWLRIGKGKSGEFYMFESATARNNYARKRAEEAGKDYEDVLADQSFEVGDDLSTIRNEVVESSQMLKDIFKALEDGAVVNPLTGKAGISDVDAIKDQVYQMYLMTLPDKDIRKKFTHRQGKTGFSADVLRNFIVSQHTASNQLSRLAYADEIRMAIGSAYAELAGNPDALKLRAFVDEIATRATAEMTPQVPGEFNWDQLASLGNQAVFYYMLTSPKSALVQMTQLPIVGIPVLAAEYGPVETAKVTARYSNLFNKLGTTKRDAAGNVVTKWGEPSINDSAYVNKHPDLNYRKILKRAWQAGQDKDLFMSTYASDMTARAQVPTAVYKGRLRRGFRATLDFMGGAFHHLERIARETMYMSAFELEFARAKKQGLNDNQAATKAIDVATGLVYEALFNYSQYNKPRLMKANAATKLGTQFMSYPLQVTSYLVRNFYGMLPYLNKEDKRDAAIKFFGTLFMTGLFAGVVGLPGYSMILGMAEGIRELMRPDMEDEEADEYYDKDDDGNPLGRRNLKLWAEEWLIPTYFGPESDLATALGLTDEQALTLQRSVKMGPISALTDLNVGASTSLDGMWITEEVPAATSREAWQNFLLGLAGPFGSMGEQIFASLDDFNNGDMNKGFEKLSPAFIRGLIASNRLREEGSQSSKGDQIRDAEWYTTGKLLAQSLGFQSTEVAEIQKKNFKAKQLEIKIGKEKEKVLARLDKEIRRFENNPTDVNEEAVEEALLDIERYNYKNGHNAISGETLAKSIQGRMKRRSLSIDGLSVSPKQAPFIYPLVEKTTVPQE
jgi:hypothetical protein